MRNVTMGVAGVVVLGLLSVPAICQATTVTFSSSGTVQNGNIYNYVYVENNGTVVNMIGGQIGNLQTSHISTFTLNGGQISEVDPLDTGPNIDIGPDGTLNILLSSQNLGLNVSAEKAFIALWPAARNNLEPEELKITGK